MLRHLNENQSLSHMFLTLFKIFNPSIPMGCHWLGKKLSLASLNSSERSMRSRVGGPFGTELC